MAKFCGRCGARLDSEGYCPNRCDGWGRGAAAPQPLSRKEQRALRKQARHDTKKTAKQAKRNAKKAAKRAKRAAMTTGQKVGRFFLKLLGILLALAVLAAAAVYGLFRLGIIEIPGLIKQPEEENGVPSGEENYDLNITLTDFQGNYYEIPVLEQQRVLFTVEVNDKIADNLIIVEEVNGQTLGYMNDSGKDGDVQANDGIYSKEVLLSSSEMGNVSYRASYYKVASNAFDIAFYREITPEEYKIFDDIYVQVSSCDSAMEAKEFLSARSDIEEYVFFDNSVTFRTKFGMTGIYEWNLQPDIKGTGTLAVSEINYPQAARNAQQVPFQPTSTMAGGKIGVLRPFRTTQFTYDDFQSDGEILSIFTGGEMDCIDDSAVTLNVMKSLDEYKIVLIDSHGTMSNMTNSAWDILDTDPYMLTGEEYTAFEMWTSADWQAGRIVVCGTDIFYGKGTIAVGAKFFDRYYSDGDFDGALFFLGTCFSLRNNSIADVLIEKGAKVVFGYSDAVYTGYCNATLFETVINSMLLSASTAGEAFDEAGRIYGTVDPNNPSCSYKMRGDTAYVIANQPQKPETASERSIALVLDTSGSMGGTPIDETRKAASNFVFSVLQQSASVGVVTYSGSAEVRTDFTQDSSRLEEIVSGLGASGGTNIDDGLTKAYEMLQRTSSKKKIIILMSDGEPNEGRTDEELIAFADEIKRSGVYIYTLGFFDALGNRTSAQYLMERLASEGCHYEVSSADDLVFFFEDIAGQINGQKYIYIRIACPVDVTVTYDGETLTSAADDLNTRTDFGTLTFEDSERSSDNSQADQVKILRLKEGVDYDVQITGTGYGKMDYTIGFMDDEGEYSDLRRFENVKITRNTVIDTTAKVADESVLKVDTDGDGKYDLAYRAGQNEYARQTKVIDWLLVGVIGAGAAALLIVVLVVIRKIKKRKVR